SPLACLDASTAEMMEGACEKALFASPETTAAAVSFVTHQLALLAASRDNGSRPAAPGMALAQLRRNAEMDRFGFVAHVLSLRHGCTAARCDALGMLTDSSRVRANLAAQAFDANVRRYAVAWALTPAASSHAAIPQPQVPAAAPSPPENPTPVASVRTPSKYFLPSASSIPAVSIMNPEPAGPPQDLGGLTETKSAASRKPQAPANPNSAAGSNATRAPVSGPMPIAPGAQ